MESQHKQVQPGVLNARNAEQAKV